MFISRPIKKISLIVLYSQLIVSSGLYAQSVLLIGANTTVYDTYREDKIAKLTLDEDTWVNYKGKYGDYFKISNFFGKNEYYPKGIIEGYVNINSVIDTASREDYENYIRKNSQFKITPNFDKVASKPNIESSNFDIDKYYLGMNEAEAINIEKTSIRIKDFSYQIKLQYSASKALSKIELVGDQKDALAFDGAVKKQTDELKQFLQEKYGNPSDEKPYPSFLEIEEGKTLNVAVWSLPDKMISLGLTEQDNLYYSKVTFQKK